MTGFAVLYFDEIEKIMNYKKENQKQERTVQLHNNLSLNHILKEEIPYIINWDKSKRGIPIFDFLIFYKKE